MNDLESEKNWAQSHLPARLLELSCIVWNPSISFRAADIQLLNVNVIFSVCVRHSVRCSTRDGSVPVDAGGERAADVLLCVA